MPIRFVGLVVLNVGESVVQIRVVMIGFVVLFFVAVVVNIGIFGFVMVGHGLSGSRFQRGGRSRVRC